MEQLKKEIGKRIRDARLQKGLKQKELAELLQTATPQMVNNWEKGDALPQANYVIKIAKTLDISTDYLLLGNDNNSLRERNANYQDVLKMLIELRNTKLFKVEYNDYYNNFYMQTTDKTIVDFVQKLQKLDDAFEVLGREVYENRLRNLIAQYDVRINNKSPR